MGMDEMALTAAVPRKWLTRTITNHVSMINMGLAGDWRVYEMDPTILLHPKPELPSPRKGRVRVA